MRFKRDVWQAGIALAGLLFFLVLMVWVPISASAYEGASGLAIARTVQAMPAMDVTATMTALQVDKLKLDIAQSC